jgi:hypothetical protein
MERINMYEISKPNLTGKAEEFIQKFEGKLESLVESDESMPPGMAITLMANMNFHGKDMPAKVFEKLKYSSGFETPDDPIVLSEALKKVDDKKNVAIDKPARVNVGNFILQYNFVRGFRPKRNATLKDVPLNTPFNYTGFHYGQEVCEPEVFNSKDYGRDFKVDAVFNRYPFAPYHFWWVPDRKGKKGEYHNQYLDAKADSHIIDAMWNFICNEGMGSNIRMGYNSGGAHASVQQLHGQGFFVTDDWMPPFERVFEDFLKDQKSFQKPDSWYLPGTRWISKSEGVEGLKDFITEMNKRYEEKKDNAYHFYITPQGTACFPRKKQGDKDYFSLLEKSPFTTGFAFFEMLGEIICPNREAVSIFDKEKTEHQIKEFYKILGLENESPLHNP